MSKLLLKLLKIKASIILTLGILLVFISCKDPGQKLKDGFWKYSDGFYIGDVIDFNSQPNSVKNDTIYKKNTPVALLIKVESRIITGDTFLYIKDLITNKQGVYIEK